jgi:hypothetical protein
MAQFLELDHLINEPALNLAPSLLLNLWIPITECLWMHKWTKFLLWQFYTDIWHQVGMEGDRRTAGCLYVSLLCDKSPQNPPEINVGAVCKIQECRPFVTKYFSMQRWLTLYPAWSSILRGQGEK